MLKNTLLNLFRPSPENIEPHSPDFDVLNEIGIALAVEKELDKLLALILEKSRKILNADAGSIFLAENKLHDQPTHLRFKLAQNDSVPVGFKEVVIPINQESLAGYVAFTRKHLLIEDVYSIPAQFPFRFYGAMDEKSGYRSKSLLSVPMVDHRGELIGVVQIWNKKQRSSKEVISFTESDLRLLNSVAAQAGVSLENATLYEEIKNLFSGFIRASVQAIEARDPTTSGHSERVSKLTLGLARVVDRVETGIYRNEHFNEQQYKELEYAALLHDFGKIGVRETVLVKAKKLFPLELDLIQSRIDLLCSMIKNDFLSKQLEIFAQGRKPNLNDLHQLTKEMNSELNRLEEFRRIIEVSNEPSILPEEISRELISFKGLTVTGQKGNQIEVVNENQILRLSLQKGSLSEEERKEIQSHVTHTYQFLKHIPWTRDLKNVPMIAHSHHEKLDGTGYPLGLNADEIPFPSKIMAVVDIFDALTSGDRPYKRAIPVKNALDILEMEAKGGQLDGELLRLFVEAKVFELTAQGD